MANVRSPAAGLIILVLAIVGRAEPVWGHASSTIPHARLSAHDHSVEMEWTAAGDDVAEIGVGLGLLPEEAPLAYQGIGDDYPTDGELATFARSALLHAYLLDNVEVRQDGRPCAAEVIVPDTVVAEGARFAFTCPDPVEVVDVRITLLHDRDPAYRTYSSDGTLWDAIHTADDPEHRWDATLVSAEGGQRHWSRLPAGLALVALTIVGALYWWRRGHGRTGTAS